MFQILCHRAMLFSLKGQENGPFYDGIYLRFKRLTLYPMIPKVQGLALIFFETGT